MIKVMRCAAMAIGERVNSETVRVELQRSLNEQEEALGKGWRLVGVEVMAMIAIWQTTEDREEEKGSV